MAALAAIRGLLTPRRIRGLSLAVRHDTNGLDNGHETDPALIDEVNQPYDSLEDARVRLDRLEELLRHRGDRRAVFLSIYTNMTRAVKASIERGVFVNTSWMRRYTRTFANYYREAFLSFEQGKPKAVPEPWRIAFGTAVTGDALVAQDAFLGINAHINYDLALTIRDVGVEPNTATKRADHRAINAILGRLIDAQQEILAELYAPGINDVDAVLGRFDERLSLFPLTEGREQAWHVGTVLAKTDWWPIEVFVKWLLRTTAVGSAAFVLSPNLAPELVSALKQVEQEQFDLKTTLDLIKSRFEDTDV